LIKSSNTLRALFIGVRDALFKIILFLTIILVSIYTYSLFAFAFLNPQWGLLPKNWFFIFLINSTENICTQKFNSLYNTSFTLYQSIF
jgi:ribonucleotide reductase beta subunit family protein with ferritin-like domain